VETKGDEEGGGEVERDELAVAAAEALRVGDRGPLSLLLVLLMLSSIITVPGDDSDAFLLEVGYLDLLGDTKPETEDEDEANEEDPEEEEEEELKAGMAILIARLLSGVADLPEGPLRGLASADVSDFNGPNRAEKGELEELEEPLEFSLSIPEVVMARERVTTEGDPPLLLRFLALSFLAPILLRVPPLLLPPPLDRGEVEVATAAA
jgi:hypothetical protein